jgi:hypothetical protein
VVKAHKKLEFVNIDTSEKDETKGDDISESTEKSESRIRE